VAREFAIPVYVHPGDAGLYGSPQNALLPWLPAAEGLPKPVGTPPVAAGLICEVLPTPGHTPGGVCYHFAAAGKVFAGDTLFQGSIGRADLPGGDLQSLLRSIQTRLLSLPADTVVYPGHGDPTTIGRERAGNPYLVMTAKPTGSSAAGE